MSIQHFGKGALRAAKNYTKGYSDVQLKVRDATSNDPWGPYGTQMNEIAQMTYNQDYFAEITEILDKRLNHKGKNWRHVFKSLTLLDYCLHVGSENVIINSLDNIYVIKTLREFQYSDEYGKDQGAIIRQKAKDITNLLSDNTRLREERNSRARMRDRMLYRSAVEDGELGDENKRRKSRSRQNARDNATDDDPRKPIKESRKTAAAVTRLNTNGRDFQGVNWLGQEVEGRRDKAAQDLSESIHDDDNQLTAPNHGFPLVNTLPHPQFTVIQPQFTTAHPQFTISNHTHPRQQQAQQEAIQAQTNMSAIPASQILQHLYLLDPSSPGIPRLIYGLIHHDREDQYLSNLQGSELTQLVDFLDKALSAVPTSDDVSRQCLRKLQDICGNNVTFPSSYTISGDLSRVGNGPVAFGGFADVWEGTHCGRKVCIKALRVTLSDEDILTKAFIKEVIIWKRLRHPNVVSFIGVTMTPLQIVSEWMPNGTLTKYVKKYPGANRIGLLLDVAEGLNYLHTNHMIHADLKGAGTSSWSHQAVSITLGQANILVDHSGCACLTDFGLSSIVRGMNSILVTLPQGFTPGWAAPEILMGADEITQQVDMFAFGTVVIEAFTGGNPFSGFKAPFLVLKTLDGEQPTRPWEAQELGLVDSVWDMTLSCWQQDPSHRPTAVGVVKFLRECYTLHAAGMPLPTLVPWQQAGSVDRWSQGEPQSSNSQNHTSDIHL